jgi:hypothetical protein
LGACGKLGPGADSSDLDRIHKALIEPS